MLFVWGLFEFYSSLGHYSFFSQHQCVGSGVWMLGGTGTTFWQRTNLCPPWPQSGPASYFACLFHEILSGIR